MSFFLVGEAAKIRAEGTVPGNCELKGSENRRVSNYEGYRRLSKKTSKGVTRREFGFVPLRMSKNNICMSIKRLINRG